MNKLKSSATVWLGFIVTALGEVLDVLTTVDVAWGGKDGIRNQFTEMGLDPKTTAIVLSVLGPVIVLARLRTLMRK